MKAIILENNKLLLEEVEKPLRKSGESLVKVTMAGICNTDIELTKGYMDFSGIPGHEFVGVVEESDNKKLIGKRVVGEINAGCGKCDWCKKEMERHCPERTVLGILKHGGAFAEYLVLPDKNLFTLQEHVTDEEAVFTEPLAAALEIHEQINIGKNDSICVIGDGKLGILITLALSLTSKDVTILGRHTNKLSIAAQNGAKPFLGDNLNRRFDIVVEASGSPSGWKTAINLVKPRGIIVLKSTYSENLDFNPAPLVINEITLVGSRCGRFAPALYLLENRKINPKPLIQKTFSFDTFKDAFQLAQSKGALKIVLQFD
ncbi:MAG: alcohol dehydrogenase catalytic domain-containing protein [Nitrospinae bacterium]|nr:alcohol dehydrogenase catalytic domain-containing protein [Nitrospinota bacterium]